MVHTQDAELKIRYLTLLGFSDDSSAVPLLARVYAAPDSFGVAARFGSRASDALLWIGTRHSLQALLDARRTARARGIRPHAQSRGLRLSRQRQLGGDFAHRAVAHRMDREAGDQLTNGRPGLGRFWPLIALGLFAAAMAVLHRELAATTLRHIVESAKKIPPSHLGRAVTFTALAYAVLPGYDAIALSYARHPLPLSRTAFGSFIAYSFSQTLGFPLFSGGSMTTGLWSSWGLSSAEIARGVGFVAFALRGHAGRRAVFLLEPRDPAPALASCPRPRGWGRHSPSWPATWHGASASAARHPARQPIPAPRLFAAQLVVAALDWALAGPLLCCSPRATVSLPSLSRRLPGRAVRRPRNHVPGGLGVFESILLVLLKAYVAPRRCSARSSPPGRPLPASLRRRRREPGPARAPPLWRARGGVVRALGGWTPRLLPQVLSGAVFLTGVILLLSGATPALRGRLAWLGSILPLGVIELSHFAGSLAGAALLVLAWGLWRRLDAAYGLTLLALTVRRRRVAPQGRRWEEASALLLVLGALIPRGGTSTARRRSWPSRSSRAGWWRSSQ